MAWSAIMVSSEFLRGYASLGQGAAHMRRVRLAAVPDFSHKPTDTAPSAGSKLYPTASVIIVSFNTCDVLRECLLSVEAQALGDLVEIIVVDNGSKDDSCAMVEREFPSARLIRSAVNLGFGAANNLGFEAAVGKYFVLLNSDAFLRPEALRLAIQHMDANPRVGLGGARLVGRNEEWQPSARMFPSLLNDFLTISGLSSKYGKSRFFGRFDRTWANPSDPAEVDWVPGAFSIVRADVLRAVGSFDPVFFLYYEEVDLCRRIQAAGHSIWYFPDVVVVHIGGESSRQVKTLSMSSSGAQLALWRMRSMMLYYRKHHGAKAWLAMQLESKWHLLRRLKNRNSSEPSRIARCVEHATLIELMKQAWQETRGGRESPARPW